MDLTVRGTRIQVMDSGLVSRGLHVVFVHGAGGEAGMWGSQAKALEGYARTLAIDLPGHGGSEGAGEADIGEYARWVEEIVEKAGAGEKYILVGHSMGGAVGLQVAVSRPRGLAGLVLVGTGAKLGVTPIIFKQLREDPEGFYRTIEKAALGSDAGPEVRDAVLASVTKTAPPVTHGDFKACDRFDMRGSLDLIQVPTLIICGEEDRMTPPSYSEYLHREIAGSSLLTVPGAGHIVMMEKPEAVNEGLRGFVASLS